MDLTQYQNDALRTESVVDEANVNYNNFISTLDIFIKSAKVLDAFKRSIFYGNDDRLNNLKNDELFDLQHTVSCFMTNVTSIDKDTTLEIDTRALHGIVGICTEAGELAEALVHTLATGEVLDKVNVHEEMHDGSWYMAVLHSALGLDWNDGLEKNISKLRARFPEAFTEADAVNRNLVEERKRLEG